MPPKKSLPVSVLLSLGLLAGCIGHLPPLRAGQVGTISGRETAGLANDAAEKKVLAEAAQLTVDHGYRYFVILPGPPQVSGLAARPGPAGTAIRPGTDVRFRALSKDQIGRGTTGVFDAYRLLNPPDKRGAANR